MTKNRVLLSVAAGACAVGAVLMCMSPARAAASSAGSAVIYNAAGSPQQTQPLTSGGSATPFTIKLPSGAACTGDGIAGYRVSSYLVPAAVDPSSLTFGPDGPQPSGFGASFRQALPKTDTTPYVNAAPDSAATAGGPGAVVNIPNFKLNAFNIDDLPAGDYSFGIVCTKPAPNASEIDKFWTGPIKIIANAADPSGYTWSSTAAATTPTTVGSTTSTTTAGGAGSTTSTTSGTGSTTSTTRATTSTTSGSTVTTASSSGTSGGSGGTTSNNAFGSVASNTTTTARTGSNTLPLAFAGLVVVLFGRIVFLSARKSMNGDHV